MVKVTTCSVRVSIGTHKNKLEQLCELFAKQKSSTEDFLLILSTPRGSEFLNGAAAFSASVLDDTPK